MTRIAAIQTAASQDRDANLAQAEHLIRGAVRDGAQLVLLPEIFAAPFVAPEPDLGYFEWAEHPDGPSTGMAAALSHELGITIQCPIFEATPVVGVYHNATYLYDGGDLVHVYRKAHLPFSNGFPEKFYFQPGSDPPAVVDAAGLRVGTIICYERHFPELGRLVAIGGADVMLVPVACSSAPTKGVFQLELSAHAAFNSMYVAAANRIGREGSKEYYGLSAVYGPDGSILDALDDQPGWAIADVDAALVRQRRHVLPYFRDRRPELYGGLTDTSTGG